MPATPEQKWQAIAKSELAHARVTAGTGFGGSAGLRVSGKIFAMLVKGELVVKLPKNRVEELTVSRVGHHFDPGQGRLMKEWVAVPLEASRPWRALVKEAHAFVESLTKP